MAVKNNQCTSALCPFCGVILVHKVNHYVQKADLLENVAIRLSSGTFLGKNNSLFHVQCMLFSGIRLLHLEQEGRRCLWAMCQISV